MGGKGSAFSTYLFPHLILKMTSSLNRIKIDFSHFLSFFLSFFPASNKMAIITLGAVTHLQSLTEISNDRISQQVRHPHPALRCVALCGMVLCCVVLTDSVILFLHAAYIDVRTKPYRILILIHLRYAALLSL